MSFFRRCLAICRIWQRKDRNGFSCLLACVAVACFLLMLLLPLLLLLVLLDVDHNPTNRFIQQIFTEKVVNPSIPRITQTVLHHAPLHPQHR